VIAPNTPRYSIVIPFYNNCEIIPTCLPSVIELYEKYENITQILAIDDCSTDKTPELLRMNYPQVTLVENPTNIGFGKTCNRGIDLAENEWVILLNSDIKIASDIIPSLNRAILTTRDLFQVAFYSFNEKGEKFEGQKFFIGKTGIFKTRNNYSCEYDDGQLYETFYACGGHCLLSREKFLQLNGFAAVYEPFYWEDADLSYRGLKRGWKVLFGPQCKVVHCHRGSIRSSNSKRKIAVIQTRNKILFFWKNVSSVRLWLYHLTGMVFRLLTSWIAGDFIFYSALLKAISKLHPLVRERFLEKTFCKKSDRLLFRIGK
jgi:GT2 family glycosyltransferase